MIVADQADLYDAVPLAASKQIAAELDCPVENIVMSATHTHSGWGPGGFPGMRPPDPNAPPPPLAGQIVDAVKQAKANLQSARVGFGAGKAYLNVNRDAIDGDTHLWTQASNLEGSTDETAAAQKTVTCPGRKRTDTGCEGMQGVYEDGDPINIRLGVLRIANIEVTSVDAEIYSSIAQRLKRESPMANTFHGDARKWQDERLSSLASKVIVEKRPAACYKRAWTRASAYTTAIRK